MGRNKLSSIAKFATKRWGKARTKSGLYVQIKSSRGAFKWLPVFFCSDIVHGSWWYVAGSLVSTIIPVVPLVDLYIPIFKRNSNPTLTEFNDAATWVLLIFSGLFYTLGSIAFVRAFESPPLPPLFAWHHFGTDELLGAWLFFFAAIPSLPYSFIFVSSEPGLMVYWANLFASIFFIGASAAFVYLCYPTHHHLLEGGKPKMHRLVKMCCGPSSWLVMHVANDWLATCWFFFWLTLMWVLGSIVFLAEAANERQCFVWGTSLIDSLLFLLGAMYFVAGSYPHDDSKDVDHDAPQVIQIVHSPLTGDFDQETIQDSHAGLVGTADASEIIGGGGIGDIRANHGTETSGERSWRPENDMSHNPTALAASRGLSDDPFLVERTDLFVADGGVDPFMAEFDEVSATGNSAAGVPVTAAREVAEARRGNNSSSSYGNVSSLIDPAGPAGSQRDFTPPRDVRLSKLPLPSETSPAATGGGGPGPFPKLEPFFENDIFASESSTASSSNGRPSSSDSSSSSSRPTSTAQSRPFPDSSSGGAAVTPPRSSQLSQLLTANPFEKQTPAQPNQHKTQAKPISKTNPMTNPFDKLPLPEKPIRRPSDTTSLSTPSVTAGLSAFDAFANNSGSAKIGHASTGSEPQLPQPRSRRPDTSNPANPFKTETQRDPFEVKTDDDDDDPFGFVPSLPNTMTRDSTGHNSASTGSGSLWGAYSSSATKSPASNHYSKIDTQGRNQEPGEELLDDFLC